MIFPIVKGHYYAAWGEDDQRDSIEAQWGILGLRFRTQVYLPFTPLSRAEMWHKNNEPIREIKAGEKVPLEYFIEQSKQCPFCGTSNLDIDIMTAFSNCDKCNAVYRAYCDKNGIIHCKWSKK